ncbi:hypothetical protein TSAR_007705 [Trichomalopsis sarcophagae]|nr:hypothetical protein TSAR_007705 [Trichomalopsis sarcophagae]
MDGTYKSRPNIYLGRSSQLLTIMASYKGKMVPIAWALMNNKLSKSYDFIFEHLKENFPN